MFLDVLKIFDDYRTAELTLDRLRQRRESLLMLRSLKWQRELKEIEQQILCTEAIVDTFKVSARLNGISIQL